MRDFHAHSNYSDGRFLAAMIEAAESAEIAGIGIADHCSVSGRELPSAERATFGFNLDLTYGRRRRGIERLREGADVEVYDAVEMDYDPRDETAIEAFLDEAGFEYAVGSVHELDGRNVQQPGAFADESEAALDDLVDRYFGKLVALVESELFDVAAHPDLIERTPPLRGRATAEHYRRAARAFAASRTVPEINAGRAGAGIVHPAEEFRDALRERGVAFTLGSDAHAPEEVGERAPFLAERRDGDGIEAVSPPGLDRC
ncbi:MAG: PHP domain-containing protein [Halobacteriales archaeon]